MANRLARVTGNIAFEVAVGERVYLRAGPCRVEIGPLLVTVWWGESFEQSTSMPGGLLDEFASAGEIVYGG